MSNIFISYARENRDTASQLASILEAIGYSVWWDKVIPAGHVFDDVIEEAINKAQCVIVLWSRHSVDSKWVKTEAGEGASRDILVPVQLEKIKPPLRFRQYHTEDLVNWNGKQDDVRFQKLLSDINGLVSPRPTDKANGDNENLQHVIEKTIDNTNYLENKKDKEIEIVSRKDTFYKRIYYLFMSLLIIATIFLFTSINKLDYLYDDLKKYGDISDVLTSMTFAIGKKEIMNDEALLGDILNGLYERGSLTELYVYNMKGRIVYDRTNNPLVSSSTPRWFLKFLSPEIPFATAKVTSGWMELGRIKAKKQSGDKYKVMWKEFVKTMIYFLLSLSFVVSLIFVHIKRISEYK